MKINNKTIDKFFSAYAKFGFGYMVFVGLLIVLFILLIGGLLFYSLLESLFF
ncbi:hypothetical protein OfM1_18810 [Lactovum odontotermitis]